MKTIFYIVSFAVFTLTIMALPMLSGLTNSGTDFVGVAHAQDTYRFLAPIGGFGEEVDVSSDNSFTDYIQNIFTMVIGFAIIAAIIVIIAAGFQYMTSTSDSGVSKAKQSIRNAVLGLVLALASVLILQTINPNLVDLNAVDTVTTSGSTFELPDWEGSMDVSAPGNGVECQVDDTTCYENKQCIEMQEPGIMWNTTIGYYCYEDDEEECNAAWEQLTDEMIDAMVNRGADRITARSEVYSIVGSCEER